MADTIWWCEEHKMPRCNHAFAGGHCVGQHPLDAPMWGLASWWSVVLLLLMQGCWFGTRRESGSMLTELPVRVQANIQVSPSGCWLWLGALFRNGYGRYAHTLAHRWVYEALRQPIPEGLTIDHLCRVRHCVNPDHLEAVTIRVNQLRGNGVAGVNARKTHCDSGHLLDEANTYIRTNGWRMCRECQREGQRRRRAAASQSDPVKP